MAGAGEYDGLWDNANGRGSWIDKASPEQRAWLEGLADHILERGEPTWTAAAAAFRLKFGLTDSPADSTIAHHVRRLVEQRG